MTRYSYDISPQHLAATETQTVRWPPFRSKTQFV